MAKCCLMTDQACNFFYQRQNLIFTETMQDQGTLYFPKKKLFKVRFDVEHLYLKLFVKLMTMH